MIRNKLFLIGAGDDLHDIFLDPLELNSVETEVTAAFPGNLASQKLCGESG